VQLIGALRRFRNQKLKRIGEAMNRLPQLTNIVFVRALFEDQLRLALLQKFPPTVDTLCSRVKVTAEVSPQKFVTDVGTALGGGSLSMTGVDEGLILIEAQDVAALVTYPSDGNFEDSVRGSCSAQFVGNARFVLKAAQSLRERYQDRNLAEIQWWFYRKPGEADYRSVILERPKPMHDAFYPFIEEGVDAYQDRYLADDASLLFLMGPPGTGKTSFIRHMIYSHQLSATITYEAGLLDSDNMFIDFLTGESNILVIEDADLILRSREGSENKSISRFLNVSDGLIKFHNKKIVFTTNLHDFSTIDPALIRAGRCFDALKFRPLSLHEADRALSAIGATMADLDNDPRVAVTLAQLLGGKGGHIEKSVGFKTA
jgi:hypothetical protein